LEQENTTKFAGRRRQVVIVLVLCVLVGLCVVAFWPGEREPEYNGKKLSEWCWLYWPWVSEGPAGQERARVAINHIGTNALPFLVQWLRYDHPSPKETMADIMGQLKDRLHRNTGARNSLRPLVRADIAVFGFEALGTNAIPAIPALTILLRDRASSPVTVGAAADALRAVGDKGWVQLAEYLRERGQPNRVFVIQNLFSARQDVGPILDVLTDCIQDPDDRVAVASATATALCSISQESAKRVTILKKGIGDSRATVREVSITFLGTLETNATPALPEIARALQDSNADVRRAATNALVKIAPEVLTNGVKDF
jgi:hypothetical protein